MSFESFKTAFAKGFLLQNSLESLSNLEQGLKEKRLVLEQIENNFFFFHQNLKLVDFFVNDIKDFKLRGKIIKILAKNENGFTKFKPFLKLNNFEKIQSFKQMKLLNLSLDYEKSELLEFARAEDLSEISNFFAPFFDPKFLFHFSKQDLRLKALRNEILLYKEKQIKAGLIFSKNLNSAMLDFIAVRENLAHKNIAFLLMNAFCGLNKEMKFYQLFVRNDNERAIKFYQRFGFEFQNTKLEFYEGKE